MTQRTMPLGTMSLSTIADRLHAAREAMSRVAYQTKYMAADHATGEPCSPKAHRALLSLRGAVIRVCIQSGEAAEIFDWMAYHHLLPHNEPASKEIAMALLDRGRQIASKGMIAA